MANNRVYLVCRRCPDDRLFLGKSFGAGNYYNEVNSLGNYKDYLNGFFDRHSQCERLGTEEVHMENQFTVGYEVLHDKNIKAVEI